MKNIVIFSGTSHVELAKMVASKLDVPLGDVTISSFSNCETNVKIGESVRDRDVYIIQSSGTGKVSDHFMELLIMIHACKIASAQKVTAVIPYFPYSAQPETPFTLKELTKKALTEHQENMIERILTDSSGYRMWSAHCGKLMANLLVEAGTDHIITLDLHDPQFQGYFDIPLDNLFSQPLMVRWIQENVPNYRQGVIVSPDAGGTKRASSIATWLGMQFAVVHRERRKEMDPSARLSSRSQSIVRAGSNTRFSSKELATPINNINLNGTDMILSPGSLGINESLQLVGQVKDKLCIIIDDIADTCSTICKAAGILKDQGAMEIVAIVTHGIFSGDALERLSESPIAQVVVSNSVGCLEVAGADGKAPRDRKNTYPPAPDFTKVGDSAPTANPTPTFKQFDVSTLFAEAIRRIHNGESVSMLFNSPAII